MGRGGGPGGPLAFLNKKSWHTGGMKQMEEVWKREHEKEQEDRKLQELKKQIEEERQVRELEAVAEAHGHKKKEERLEFMYPAGLMTGIQAAEEAKKREDDHALGKPVELAKEDDTVGQLKEQPGSLFLQDAKTETPNEQWARLQNDPMMAIKLQEQAALKKIRQNPVKMDMIRRQVQDMKAKAKAEKKAKKEKKKEKKKAKKAMKDGAGGGGAGGGRSPSRSPSRSRSPPAPRARSPPPPPAREEPRDRREEPRDRREEDRRPGLGAHGGRDDRGRGGGGARDGGRGGGRDERRRSRSPARRRSRSPPRHHRDRDGGRRDDRDRGGRRDRSPPRRRSRSPPRGGDRRRRHDSPSRSPPRGGDRKRRHDSSSPEPDKRRRSASPPARSPDRDADNSCVGGKAMGGLEVRVPPPKQGVSDDASWQKGPVSYGLSHGTHVDDETKERLAERNRRRMEEERKIEEKRRREADAEANAPKYVRKQYQAGKLSEEEKARRLAEMMGDAETHENDRWSRLKKAKEKDDADGDTGDAVEANKRLGHHKEQAAFLKDAEKNMYGAAMDGSTLEDRVSRRKYFSQRGGGQATENAFRR